MGILSVDLNNINLDGDPEKDYPENHVRLMVMCNKFKQRKSCKTELSRILMPVAWHPWR